MGEDKRVKDVALQPARTGRPRSRTSGFARGEAVMVTARLPAELAALVYETADETRKPVSTVVAEILASNFRAKEVSTT